MKETYSRKIVMGLTLLCLTATANAAQPIDKTYIKSLAAPGKTVLVIEYYDGQGNVTDRKGYASPTGYKASSPTDIIVSPQISLHLYGLEPCKGDMVNKREAYAGSCTDYAKSQLQALLNSPRVLLCRAFVTEETAPSQNVTCYGYYNYPGAMETVDMLEQQLVSVGALRVSRKPDGSSDRADLAHGEEIGQEGQYGMWADPRVSGQ